MRYALWILAAAVTCAPAARAGGTDIASVLHPGVAIGDFEFQGDAMATRPGTPGRITVRVLVQLPVRVLLDQTHADAANVRVLARAFDAKVAFDRLRANQLDFERKSGSRAASDTARAAEASADVAIERLLADFEGIGVAGEAEERARVESADRTRLLGTDYRLFELTLDLAPGDYVIESRIENLSRRKRGLLDRLRKRPMASVSRVLMRIPDLRQEPALADPAFYAGYTSHNPTAARLFGLLSDSLHVQSTLYGTGRYDVRVQAADRDGHVQWSDSTQVQAQGSAPLSWSASVNTLPAGQYVLQLTADGPGGGVTVSRAFDVAWSLVTWTKSRRDLDGEAELALSEAEYDRYHALPVGERERFMEDFWKLHDPTPGTAFNETRADFNRRVAYADLNFPEISRGALTDRGRVFVRYGPPDELQEETVPTHLAGRGGEAVMDKVDDVYVPSDHKQGDDAVGSTRGTSTWDGSLRTQERGRVVGLAHEVTAYELWIYHGGGAPWLPEDKGVAIDAGLRVLFMDTTGYGRYRLRKSSARLDIRGMTANF